MSETGRLTQGLGHRTRQVVFGAGADSLIDDLDLITQVDQAHLVMLARQRLIAAPVAAQLLGVIEALRAQRFVPLHGRPAPRGTYLMYENYLIERLGEAVGGVIHTGRSRNDLKATTTALWTRGWLLDLVSELGRLEAVLLGRARAYRDVVMPAYTHYQAAMPVTYGYYLLGVALALAREVDGLLVGEVGLRQCPMGAGAVAGTDLPVDADVTAHLLGFDRGPLHAMDVVASRDTVLRLLSSATGVGLLLSRLAADLQLWSTDEFGLIRFPDRLVGGSSAMPQKRNAFLLEHVKAKAGRAVGAWTAAATMVRSTPFSNTIEVGTEAVAVARPGMEAVAQAAILSQAVVGGAAPEPEQMHRRAAEGFTTATAIANALVRAGIPFRTAHQAVGAAVRQAVEDGSTALTGISLPDRTHPVPPGMADVAQVLAGTSAGGGPGAFDRIFAQARTDAGNRATWLAGRRGRLEQADTELRQAVAEWRAGP